MSVETRAQISVEREDFRKKILSSCFIRTRRHRKLTEAELRFHPHLQGAASWQDGPQVRLAQAQAGLGPSLCDNAEAKEQRVVTETARRFAGSCRVTAREKKPLTRHLSHSAAVSTDRWGGEGGRAAAIKERLYGKCGPGSQHHPDSLNQRRIMSQQKAGGRRGNAAPLFIRAAATE